MYLLLNMELISSHCGHPGFCLLSMFVISVAVVAFDAESLFVEHHEEHPACKILNHQSLAVSLNGFMDCRLCK